MEAWLRRSSIDDEMKILKNQHFFLQKITKIPTFAKFKRDFGREGPSRWKGMTSPLFGHLRTKKKRKKIIINIIIYDEKKNITKKLENIHHIPEKKLILLRFSNQDISTTRPTHDRRLPPFERESSCGSLLVRKFSGAAPPPPKISSPKSSIFTIFR